MKRHTRAEKAKETLQIIEQGYYQIEGDHIHLEIPIKDAIASSRLYMPEDFPPIVEKAYALCKKNAHTCTITVENCTVLEGAEKILHQHKNKLGCLNFASAKNPGGGFLNGSLAQEESLALSSCLYATQMHHFKMYEYNRGRHTYLYSDAMIYSPDVMFFRNDDGDLLKTPYSMNVLTSPAVNVGAIKNNKPEELADVRQTMLNRLDKVLALFLTEGCEHLLLGAWGCGVFMNEPEDVANYFAHFLCGDGKYAHAFKSVFFAVLDRSKTLNNIQAFEKRFI